MRATLFLWALGFCAGCASTTSSRWGTAETSTVRVDEVVLAFGESGKADLAFTLAATRESALRQANEVQWELWLDGRYFAAGIWRAEVELKTGEETKWQVKAPLIFRPGPVKNESMPVSVGVKGFLVGSTGLRTLREAFARQEVLWVAGSPVWDSGK